MVASPARLRFRDEWRDFLRCLRRPCASPRWPAPVRGGAVVRDWLTLPPWRRLLQWALALWTLNLLVLGPIAMLAAGQGGATHRVDLSNLPWLTALIWAPVVEELVFRYGLRRPHAALWVVPLAGWLMFQGPRTWAVAGVCLILLACWLPALRPARRPNAAARRQLRAYRRYFPWAFHLGALAFAGLHLYNFNLHHMPVWLMPLLVLPQWLTGLALAWMRMRRGIGAAMALHALFNGGPLLLIWLLMQLIGS